MPADFPDNPTVGDSFTIDGRSWTWNGSTWDAVIEPPVLAFVTSATAPSNPTPGLGWFDSNSGQFFIYYDNHWVEFGTNLTGPQGPAGTDGTNGTNGTDGVDGAPGVVSATAPLAYNSGTQNISIDLSSYYTSTQVDQELANLVASAPATLDTLNELSAALGDDPNFATTVTNQIATKTSTGKAIAMAIVFG